MLLSRRYDTRTAFIIRRTSVSLVIVFIVLAFVLILFLWGGTMLLQGWLYQDVADRLPIRAAACGTVMAGFLTIWCLIDLRSGGKYDSLLEFSPMEITEHDSFETVMKRANGEETIVRYQKRGGGKGSTSDFLDAKGQHWKKNTNDSIAAAILLHEKDVPTPARFTANLDAKGNFPAELTSLRYTDPAGRYMNADTLGRVYRKKSGVLFANIFLNLFLFVLWWMIFWLGLRFAIWHGFGLALVLWLPFVIAIQPLLFNQTRPKETRSPAAAVEQMLANGELRK
jgi:hypothetical protein